MPLSDSNLGVHKVFKKTTHTIVDAPLPNGYNPTSANDTNTVEKLQAWEAVYPKDSINPGNSHSPPGGFGFYISGPETFSAQLKGNPSPAEVIISYQVMFQEGWEWARGGKLPGIYGGMGDSAYGCTGGRQNDRCSCFNLRLMWREDGAGELYAYLPQTSLNTDRLLQVPPRSIQHPDYGFSVGRGAWYFTPGTWMTVAQRIKLNNIDHTDGEIEVYINGKSVILVKGLTLRTSESPSSRVQGLHFQTFFGGHTPEWASPKEQRTWFTGISGAILRSPSLDPLPMETTPSSHRLAGEL